MSDKEKLIATWQTFLNGNSWEWRCKRFWKKLTLQQLQEFIAAGVDVNAKASNGDTPLNQVINYSTNIEVIKELIKAREGGINAKDKYGFTLLHEYLGGYDKQSVESVENVRELIRAGADVNAKNNYGWTPLHSASVGYNSSVKVIKELIKAGADVNAKDNDGDTPLHEAASRNESANVIKELIRAGADVNAKNNNGDTPLYRATYKMTPHKASIKELIKAGADVNVKNNDGDTPLNQAVGYRANIGIIKELIKAGADVNAQKNEYGRTPLHEAALSSEATLLNYNATVIKELIKAGADVNAKNNDGNTPLH